MLEPLDTVAVLCLVIFCLSLMALAISLRRRAGTSRPRRRISIWPIPRTAPSARSTQDALKKLYTVAQRISQSDYRLDDDTECPICLASFSRRSEDGESRPVIDVDLEAGLGAPGITTATGRTPRRTASAAAKQEKTSGIQSGENEILRINRCGHTFHSHCLANWFLREKYDCPLCRATYYRPRELHEQGQGQGHGQG
ncbi:hypothetical protein F5X97DRAFT_322613 [Nemania serpens]|nr:hypothetical protein F5X97DRAFT_322613 [Nemania serpens]